MLLRESQRCSLFSFLLRSAPGFAGPLHFQSNNSVSPSVCVCAFGQGQVCYMRCENICVSFHQAWVLCSWDYLNAGVDACLGGIGALDVIMSTVLYTFTPPPSFNIRKLCHLFISMCLANDEDQHFLIKCLLSPLRS